MGGEQAVHGVQGGGAQSRQSLLRVPKVSETGRGPGWAGLGRIGLLARREGREEIEDDTSRPYCILKVGTLVFVPPSPPPSPSNLLPPSSFSFRYNEFHDFNEKLKKRFPDAGLKLPGKRILGNNFDPEFIKQRREGLHDFVSRLMKVLRHIDMYWQCFRDQELMWAVPVFRHDTTHS